MRTKRISFDPQENFLGGYTDGDGTVEFYGRINAILKDDYVVLDVGAGRAAWYEDDKCTYRRNLRTLRSKVKCVIAVDVDSAVFDNNSSDENRLVENGIFPVEDNSVDLVVADYVLEHISDPEQFASEVNRVLKSSGIFCARTPHRLNYISLAASLIPNKFHSKVLKFAQLKRQERDVFPTIYKLNTLKVLKFYFKNFSDYSLIFRSEPSYYFGRKSIYLLAKLIHHLMPIAFSGTIFVYKIRS